MSAGSLATDLATWSTALASLWARMFWQSTALAAMSWLALKGIPRISAQRQYRWFFGCYVFSFVLPLAAGMLPSPPAHTASGAAAPLVTLDARWAMLWAAVCALASSYALLRFAAGLWSMHRMLRTASEASSADRLRFAGALACDARGPVRLLISVAVNAPVATGLGRPTVVLPEGLLEQLSPAELEQVLRHEVEHLARRDDWAALFFALVRVAAPLIPALLWLEHQLAVAREMACDDAVLRTTRPRAYAQNLARLAATRFLTRAPRFAQQLLGHRSQLAERIDHILENDRRSEPRLSLRRLLPVGAAALLLCCGLVESPAVVGFAAVPSAVAQATPATPVALPMHAVPASLHVAPSAAGTSAPTTHPAVANPARRRHHATTPKPLLLARDQAPEVVQAASVQLTSAPVTPSAFEFVVVFWSNTRQGLWFTTTTFILHRHPAAPADDPVGLHQI